MAKANLALEVLLQAKERGWVRVKRITWQGSDMMLELALASRRNGTERDSWQIECRNVLGYSVVDVNGGGLAVYGTEHPVVRQRVDRRAHLHFWGKALRVSHILGELLRAHDDTVGDFAAFDDYLGPTHGLIRKLEAGHGRLAKGPQFLLGSYAAALRENGIKTRLVLQKPAARRKAVGLHFGNSIVVAQSMRAQQIASRS
jgi:hypothetical protein